jgi:hypothetical protein
MGRGGGEGQVVTPGWPPQNPAEDASLPPDLGQGRARSSPEGNTSGEGDREAVEGACAPHRGEGVSRWRSLSKLRRQAGWLAWI